MRWVHDKRANLKNLTTPFPFLVFKRRLHSRLAQVPSHYKLEELDIICTISPGMGRLGCVLFFQSSYFSNQEVISFGLRALEHGYMAITSPAKLEGQSIRSSFHRVPFASVRYTYLASGGGLD
jgi:hypothetical protein